ncbi:MAG TPA: UvrB/UvrC motif-containing protein [Gemmatimonadaceae bacterium]|jgi:excinuclease ABC subunit C|nr:UvrB/UvrC motif-containing protein [Gemmatimonadaceae bacterium]
MVPAVTRIRNASQRRQPTSDDQIKLMREAVRAGAADRPGIYRMLSSTGEVVYVGKSKRVRSRLLSYFRCSYPEEKGARILREAESIDWEYTPSEFAALLKELRLIKTYRPRLNVAMKRDAMHYSFIKLTRGAAPKLAVVRGASADDASVYYGPFVGMQRVGEALRELSDVLMLRDCRGDMKMHFSDQQELFHIMPRTPGCIRYEIGRCLGPCVGGCSVSEYEGRVSMARAFLDGSNDGPIETLRTRMDEASNSLEFERAASYRDKLARLEALREQFGRLRFAVEKLSFMYTVKGYDGDDRVYLVKRGVVRAEVNKPRTSWQREKLKRLAEEMFSIREPSSTTVPTHEIDELLLLSSWFRRFPDEMDKTRKVS